MSAIAIHDNAHVAAPTLLALLTSKFCLPDVPSFWESHSLLRRHEILHGEAREATNLRTQHTEATAHLPTDLPN